MKKATWILGLFIVMLLVGVILFVNHDTQNKNSVETVESMEYTVIDDKPIEQLMDEYNYDPEDVVIENQGYLVIDKDGITGYIDSEGNTYSLED